MLRIYDTFAFLRKQKLNSNLRKTIVKLVVSIIPIFSYGETKNKAQKSSYGTPS